MQIRNCQTKSSIVPFKIFELKSHFKWFKRCQIVTLTLPILLHFLPLKRNFYLIKNSTKYLYFLNTCWSIFFFNFYKINFVNEEIFFNNSPFWTNNFLNKFFLSFKNLKRTQTKTSVEKKEKKNKMTKIKRTCIRTLIICWRIIAITRRR